MVEQQDLRELRLTADEVESYGDLDDFFYTDSTFNKVLDAQITKARAPLQAQLEAANKSIAELECENKALREALKELLLYIHVPNESTDAARKLLEAYNGA